MADLAPGTVFAGCRIESVAGRGGMGVVYRAMELSLGRPVAIKVIGSGHATDAEFRERFQREAQMAARIDHPHVVPLYAAGETDGLMYLVMRYVQGTDLHRELADRGPLAPERAVRVIAQVASALDAAHAAGLVHRDVKPANVLLGDGHVYLTDFGLTRVAAADTSVTESGQWMGTVDYASPEQLQGNRCDARSDVYALGCVLFAALTGGPPYPRGTVPATMVAHLREPVPRVSGVAGVPAVFDRVIARALAKSPEDRYPSTGDLARAAEAALRDEHVTEEERSVARGGAAPPGAAPAVPAPVTDVTLPTVPVTAVTLADSGAVPARGYAPEDPTRVLEATAPESRRERPEDPTIALRPTPEPPARDRPGNGTGRPAGRVAGRRGGPRHQPPPSPPPPKRRRGRLRRFLLGLLLAGAALAGAGAIATLGGGSPPLVGPVDDGEVRAVLDDFAAAVAREDPAALERTLLPDAARVTPGDRQDGRAAVVAEYRRQFAANAFSGYRLEDVEIDGGDVGRAVARYSAPREDASAITGKIVFDVVREDGRVRIALVAATPD